jgi:hypothetical protein
MKSVPTILDRIHKHHSSFYYLKYRIFMTSYAYNFECLCSLLCRHPILYCTKNFIHSHANRNSIIVNKDVLSICNNLIKGKCISHLPNGKPRQSVVKLETCTFTRCIGSKLLPQLLRYD